MEYRINTESGHEYGSVIFNDYRGAIRNIENRQVEFIYATHVEPKIIYDFNLSVGDTIKNEYDSEYYLSSYQILKVVSIDSILYCGNYHKKV